MRTALRVLGIFLVLLIIAILLFLWKIYIPAPKVDKQITPQSYHRIEVAPDYYKVNNCWLKKNKYGIWEMYLEGTPYERGVIYGVLAKELIEKQEASFVDEINLIVPNRFYQQFLKYFVAWFNRDIYKYIPQENLEEIYGISLSFSDKYDYIGPKYYRILNYHAAHDIGHALNDFNMVGCTSFAVNKEFSADSSLLIARNFDFYVGDEFAKEKMMVFVNPDSGYSFASYSWAGLTGVVSGMNEKGITVTINASKSDIPFTAKDPISLLAREILQYASNIPQALAIAQQRQIFVSESLLVGSAADDKAVIIEKSPQKIDTYESGKNYLICANHYQGEVFMKDSVNLANIHNSDSKYRFDRMNQLLSENFPLTYNKAAGILRNKEGMDGKNIGYGNSKSLNQLIAHHAILFKPQEEKMWVSTPPYQLGAFLCYDLNKVFSGSGTYLIDSMNVAADSFLYTKGFKDYERYKTVKQQIREFTFLNIPFNMDENSIAAFVNDNPESYLTYELLGDYFKKKESYQSAKEYYEQSLKHDVASNTEVMNIRKNIDACIKKLK